MAGRASKRGHENHYFHRNNCYDFQYVLTQISEEILQGELDRMLFILSDVIPGRKRDEMRQAYQVFAYLKKRGLFHESDVTYLVNLLKDIEREDLAKRLKHYKRHKVKPYKCIVVGNSSCGKTALALRVMYNSFTEDHLVTVGPDYLKRNIYLEERLVPVEMWDTAGMERLSNIIPDSYFREASVVMIVFDIIDRESFESTTSWRDEVKRKCADDTVLLLIGNKTDLEKERKVTKIMGETRAREMGVKYLEVSAKNGHNTDLILNEIAKAAPPDELHHSNGFKLRSMDASTQTTGSTRRKRRFCRC